MTRLQLAALERDACRMRAEEIRRLMREATAEMRSIVAFALSNTGEWDYQYQDSWGCFAVFSVRFDAQGRAISKFSLRINDGGDHQ